MISIYESLSKHLKGQLDPPVRDVTFFQGGQLDLPVRDVTLFNQGGLLRPCVGGVTFFDHSWDPFFVC